MKPFIDKMKLFFSTVWDFIEPFVEILLTSAGQALAQSAMAAVTQVAKDPTLLTNDSKRNAALDMIRQDLINQGVAIGTSTINAALEAAVVHLKAKG